MKAFVIFTSLIFAAAGVISAQQPENSVLAGETAAPVTDTNQNADLPASNTDVSKLKLVQTNSTYVRPNAKTRTKRYINGIIGPFALARQVAGAGISTWRNSPEEWGDRWEGFGRRVASNFGKNVIKQTTIYGLDEALKYDSHFYRSKSKSVGARVTNALISPVTARDKNGKRVIGIPRLAGTYTANIVAYETWFPARYSWKDGLKSGTISLGFNAAFNLVKEFIWKK
ncbi:MAG TPA: hypothetical protein VK468_10370 [Pyrinomonadaceae bacterium]|nr:hypothetical protein [Pyrinomonadaceae bacterium]